VTEPTESSAPVPQPPPLTVTTRNICARCRGVIEYLAWVGWAHAVDFGANHWTDRAVVGCEDAVPALWLCSGCQQPRPTTSRGGSPVGPRIVDGHVDPTGRPCSGAGRAGLPPPMD
jgi:hypothetical protein